MELSWIDAKFFNILHMGVAFLLVFSTFNSAGFIQEIVIDSYAYSNETCEGNCTGEPNMNPHAGYYSLGIIYAVFTVMNLFAPPVIALVGPKWAMVAGASCYVCFVASFLLLSEWLLYLASAVNGFGAAILWTGQGNYLTLNSNDETIGRNSGVTWALLQSGLLVGGIMLYFVFRSTPKILTMATIRLMYAMFSCVMLAGVVLLALLRSPQARADKEPILPPPTTADQSAPGQDNSAYMVESYSQANPNVVDAVGVHDDVHRDGSGVGKKETRWEQWLKSLVGTFRLLFTPNMLLLCVVFCYTGLEQTFWTSIYPTCLGFTDLLPSTGNTLVAYHSLCAAGGEIIGGGLFGLMGNRFNRFGRNPIIISAFVLHAATFYAVFWNVPSMAPLEHTRDLAFIRPEPSVALALVCSFTLGLADACWNTQVYSLLGSFYADTSAEAFAIFKCLQSLTACASLYYGAALTLEYQLAILCLSSALAALCFFPVEFHAQIKRPAGLKVA